MAVQCALYNCFRSAGQFSVHCRCSAFLQFTLCRAMHCNANFSTLQMQCIFAAFNWCIAGLLFPQNWHCLHCIDFPCISLRSVHCQCFGLEGSGRVGHQVDQPARIGFSVRPIHRLFGWMYIKCEISHIFVIFLDFHGL